jgi:hypothetical protein
MEGTSQLWNFQAEDIQNVHIRCVVLRAPEATRPGPLLTALTCSQSLVAPRIRGENYTALPSSSEKQTDASFKSTREVLRKCYSIPNCATVVSQLVLTSTIPCGSQKKGEEERGEREKGREQKQRMTERLEDVFIYWELTICVPPPLKHHRSRAVFQKTICS